MKGYVYLIWAQSTGYFKIGKSKYCSVRLRNLQTGNVGKLGLVCSIPTDDMSKLEKQLHKQFEHRRVSGEWFALTWDDSAVIRSMA